MADFARGQLLVDLRGKRHLSQEDAAHEIGTTAKSLRAWEHGGKIRWENAKRVAEFYGVDPERLVSRDETSAEGTGNFPPPADPYAERLDRIEEKLDELLRRIPERPARREPPDPPGELGRRVRGPKPKPSDSPAKDSRPGKGSRRASGG